MTQAHDAEHQTPAAPSPTGSSEMKGEHYTMGHARLGRYAGERRGVPATRAGQGGAYAVVSWFRQQGYQVVRSRPGTMPPDLLGLVVRGTGAGPDQADQAEAFVASCDRRPLQRGGSDSRSPAVAGGSLK